MLPNNHPPSTAALVVQGRSLRMLGRRTYNATCPACCLPPEILSMIFLHFHVDFLPLEVRLRCNPTHRMLLNITHVCRYWRTTALGYARLWTGIPLVDRSCIAAFAARSKNMPVSVRGRVSTVKREITSRFRALPLSRLEYLHLECAPRHGVVLDNRIVHRIVKMDLPGEEAPMLKVLNLSTRHPDQFAQLLQTPKKMPALICLCVSRVEIDLTWLGTLTNLISLNILHLEPAARVSVLSLVGALRNLRRLKHLEIVSALRANEPSAEEVQNLAPIEHMRLQIFIVLDVANPSVILLKNATRAGIHTFQSQIFVHTSLLCTELALTSLADTICKTFLQHLRGARVIDYMRSLVCSVGKESAGDVRVTFTTASNTPLVSNPRAAFVTPGAFTITFSLGIAPANLHILSSLWWRVLGIIETEYPRSPGFFINTLVMRADASLPDDCSQFYYWAGYPTLSLKEIALIRLSVAGFCMQFADHRLRQDAAQEPVTTVPPPVLPALEGLQVFEFDFEQNSPVLDALKMGLIRRAQQKNELPADAAHAIPQMTLTIVDCRITQEHVQMLAEASEGPVVWDGKTDGGGKLKLGQIGATAEDEDSSA
ncbi:hypothetical protein DENSPDRAFT_839566 [Dentipellis sp. KUC8613]|nr:hypothetical protein DENSPDRAFT_839566 [Dentipellis sp. KUC8613]